MSKRKGRKTHRQKITRANTKLLNLKAIWVGSGNAESVLQCCGNDRSLDRAQRIQTSVREEIHFVEPDIVGLPQAQESTEPNQ